MIAVWSASSRLVETRDRSRRAEPPGFRDFAQAMLGEGHVFGTIEPGKRADMLILAADPLSDIRNTRTLEVVIMNSKVLDRSSLLSDE